MRRKTKDNMKKTKGLSRAYALSEAEATKEMLRMKMFLFS
jgi:hypothetical protein